MSTLHYYCTCMTSFTKEHSAAHTDYSHAIIIRYVLVM
jgi:hypothetical protein